MIRAVGIDPGATTGLVCVDLPENLDITKGKWVGGLAIRASTLKQNTDAEDDRSLYEKIKRQLAIWKPSLIVLEEPSDVAIGGWDNKSRGNVRGHGRGTMFGLGRAYGLALAATGILGAEARVFSYPCTTRRGQKTPGWMQGIGRKITPRDQTLFNMKILARSIGAPDSAVWTDSGEDREDVLMALGVLRFHTSISTHVDAISEAQRRLVAGGA